MLTISVGVICLVVGAVGMLFALDIYLYRSLLPEIKGKLKNAIESIKAIDEHTGKFDLYMNAAEQNEETVVNRYKQATAAIAKARNEFIEFNNKCYNELNTQDQTAIDVQFALEEKRWHAEKQRAEAINQRAATLASRPSR